MMTTNDTANSVSFESLMQQGNIRAIYDFLMTLENIDDFIYNDEDTETNALHIACSTNSPIRDQVVVLLVRLNANLNYHAKVDRIKYLTALHLACINNYHSTIELLLNLGADVDLHDSNLLTPQSYANKLKSESAELLECFSRDFPSTLKVIDLQPRNRLLQNQQQNQQQQKLTNKHAQESKEEGLDAEVWSMRIPRKSKSPTDSISGRPTSTTTTTATAAPNGSNDDISSTTTTPDATVTANDCERNDKRKRDKERIRGGGGQDNWAPANQQHETTLDPDTEGSTDEPEILREIPATPKSIDSECKSPPQNPPKVLPKIKWMKKACIEITPIDRARVKSIYDHTVTDQPPGFFVLVDDRLDEIKVSFDDLLEHAPNKLKRYLRDINYKGGQKWKRIEEGFGKKNVIKALQYRKPIRKE